MGLLTVKPVNENEIKDLRRFHLVSDVLITANTREVYICFSLRYFVLFSYIYIYICIFTHFLAYIYICKYLLKTMYICFLNEPPHMSIHVYLSTANVSHIYIYT